MNIEAIEDFITVCKYENITKAAQVLNISQPALSKSIKLLESYYDTHLFDRKGKKIELNNNGRLLLDFANELIFKHDNLKATLLNNNKSVNILKFAYNDSDIIPLLISDFISLNADIDFKFSSIYFNTMTDEKIIQRILNNDINVAVLTKPLYNKDINNLLVYQNHLFVVISENDTRFNEGNEYYLKDFNGMHFIRKARQSSDYVDRIDDVIKKHNIKINVNLVDKDIAIELENKTDYCYFLSSLGYKMQKHTINLKNKRIIKLVDDEFTQNIYIIYKNKKTSAVTTRYVNWIKANYTHFFEGRKI